MKELSQSLETSSENASAINSQKIRYAGINIRLLANFIDLLLLLLLTAPIFFFTSHDGSMNLPAGTSQEVIDAMQQNNMGQISNEQLVQTLAKTGFIREQLIPRLVTYTFLSTIFIGTLFIVSWKMWDATPGKIMFSIKIVDKKTMVKPTLFQYVIRFLTIVLTLGLGHLTVTVSKSKRAIHDYLSGTAVIYTKELNPALEKKKFKFQLYIGLILLIICIIILSNKYSL